MAHTITTQELWAQRHNTERHSKNTGNISTPQSLWHCKAGIVISSVSLWPWTFDRQSCRHPKANRREEEQKKKKEQNKKEHFFLPFFLSFFLFTLFFLEDRCETDKNLKQSWLPAFKKIKSEQTIGSKECVCLFAVVVLFFFVLFFSVVVFVVFVF